MKIETEIEEAILKTEARKRAIDTWLETCEEGGCPPRENIWYIDDRRLWLRGKSKYLQTIYAYSPKRIEQLTEKEYRKAIQEKIQEKIDFHNSILPKKRKK